MNDDQSEFERPVWQVVAGSTARFFGIRFFDMYFGQRDLSQPTEPVASPLPVEIRLATGDDLDRISRRSDGTTRIAFDHNLAIGSICHIAVHEGSVTGYLWVNQNVVEMAGMHLAQLSARQAFTHSAFVFPAYRGNMIYQRLRQAVCSELYESGCLSVVCLVDKANIRTIEVLKREGVVFHKSGVLKIPGIKPIVFCRMLT